ncbi:Imm26 family immunity protein [Microlunatus soli]|nr:Imm26 family immunity protein [Microlunatus soli]
MTALDCAEGDWIAVPLRSDGYAVGIIARMKEMQIFGYFFGPKRDAVPELDELSGLRPDDAVLVGAFGGLGLKKGKWAVLGRFDNWDRADWAFPPLVRYEELTGQTYRVTYDDNDPGKVLHQEVVEPGAAEQGPRDGLMGHGFVELKLTKLLD